MPVVETLQILVDRREDEQITITNQGSAREWPKLCDHPLDFHYIPSAMGAAISLGLGLALAQPERHVLVISGDGSLLMNLGCLVSVMDSGIENLTIAVLDNGIYEVTGGQATAAAETRTDFAGVARAMGFPVCSQFDDIAHWEVAADEILSQPGPRFVHLIVEPERDDYLLDPPMPMSEQLSRFRSSL